MQLEGLWQRLCRRQRRLFTGIPISYLRPNYSVGRHSGGITTSPSPQNRQKAQNKRKEKSHTADWSPPSLLLHPLGKGLDLHLDLRLHLLPQILLGGRDLSLGYLGGLSPFFPTRAGRGSPPPRKLAGLLLGCAGIGPRPMRALAIGALGSRMRAPTASSDPASLDRTLMVMRGVLLCADGASGGC